MTATGELLHGLAPPLATSGLDGVRIGIDLVEIAEVADAAARFGGRYLRRVFTAHELAASQNGILAESLAARFAAKEATVKVLEPDGARPDWRGIEVYRRPSGACELRLRGFAGELAQDAGLRSFAVSLTHDGGFAAAVVVALAARPRRLET